MICVMSTVGKALVGLALVLPVAAFVVGSVVSTSADSPDPRDTIIMRDISEDEEEDPSQEPSREPREPNDTNDGPVVPPRPEELDDDDDDD